MQSPPGVSRTKWSPSAARQHRTSFGFAAVAGVFALSVLVAAQDSPCDPGYTFYPDLNDTEAGSQSKFSGSCIMLHLQSDPFFPRATSTKNFATAARDFCAFTHSGGRLLSLASLSPSPYGLLALVKALTANATTPLVLVGGIQNPNAVGSKFTKWSNWIWTDAGTNASVLNQPSKSTAGYWGPGQPDDRNSSFTGTAPVFESGAANFLAVQRITGYFFDVSGSEVMDILCQYRTPAPCPPGFKLYWDRPKGNEYGLSSCVNVYPPATLQVARDICATAAAGPLNGFTTYLHLATFYRLSGTRHTPLTQLVRDLSTIRGIGGPLYWTGGDIVLAGAGPAVRNTWADNRTFDSSVANFSVPVNDNTHIVLNLSANAASLQYYVDAGAATTLPFVCEIDIAVRIAPASQSSVDSGNLLSFAASYNPNPVPLCVDGYTLASGKVACRQAGYDTGRASVTSYKDNADGVVTRVFVGKNCTGDESFLEDCQHMPTQAILSTSATDCSVAFLPMVDCYLDNLVPAQFPSITTPGDISSGDNIGISDNSRNAAVIAVVVVLGALLAVLLLACIIKTHNKTQLMKLGHHGHHDRSRVAVSPAPSQKGATASPVTPKVLVRERRGSGDRPGQEGEEQSPGSVNPRLASWLGDQQHESIASPPHQLRLGEEVNHSLV